MADHGYICECPDKHCVLRVRLKPLDWQRVCDGGRVVSSLCGEAIVARRRGDVVSTGPGYVVVKGHVGSVAA